jgi:uncharacterized protein YbaP (TraB family)
MITAEKHLVAGVVKGNKTEPVQISKFLEEVENLGSRILSAASSFISMVSEYFCSAGNINANSLNSGKKYAEGFHYVVTRNGKTVADIVGTCHAGKEEKCGLNPTIEKAARKAKKFAFEVVSSQKFIDDVNSHRKTCDRKQTLLDYCAYNLNNYDKEKTYRYPSSVLEKEDIGLSPEYGTEEQLIRKACETNSDVAVYPLETPQEYVRNTNYFEMHEAFYKQKMDDGEISNEEIKSEKADCYNAYLEGNETLLNKAKKWDKCHDSAFHHYLVKKRNYTFATRVADLIKESSAENRTLIAIGCAHLLGKHGVPNLLRQQLGNDYSVEPKRFINFAKIWDKAFLA